MAHRSLSHQLHVDSTSGERGPSNIEIEHVTDALTPVTGNGFDEGNRQVEAVPALSAQRIDAALQFLEQEGARLVEVKVIIPEDPESPEHRTVVAAIFNVPDVSDEGVPRLEAPEVHHLPDTNTLSMMLVRGAAGVGAATVTTLQVCLVTLVVCLGELLLQIGNVVVLTVQDPKLHINGRTVPGKLGQTVVGVAIEYLYYLVGIDVLLTQLC